MEKLMLKAGVNLPVVEDLIKQCKKLNSERGADDNPHNVIEAAMAIFTTLSLKPTDQLVDTKNSGQLAVLEKNASDHLKRINEINMELRKAIDEHDGLLEQVKKSKEAVVEEYKDALGQFRSILENQESGGTEQFQSILEGVIREVITDVDSEQATCGGETSGDNTEIESANTDAFSALFEDQNISEMFDQTFAGMNLAEPPNITVTHRTTYSGSNPLNTHVPIIIQPPTITTTTIPEIGSSTANSRVTTVVEPEPLVPERPMTPPPPSRPPPNIPPTPARRRTVRPRRRALNL